MKTFEGAYDPEALENVQPSEGIERIIHGTTRLSYGETALQTWNRILRGELRGAVMASGLVMYRSLAGLHTIHPD